MINIKRGDLIVSSNRDSMSSYDRSVYIALRPRNRKFNGVEEFEPRIWFILNLLTMESEIRNLEGWCVVSHIDEAIG